MKKKINKKKHIEKNESKEKRNEIIKKYIFKKK